MKGFTAVEILIVLAVFGLLLGSSMLALGPLRSGSDLQSEARAFQRVLEFARSRTIASEADARYGVYATSTVPHRYILFQGDDYDTRIVAEDEVYELHDTIEFESIAFGGGSEVVFDRIEGTTSQAGNAVLRVKTEPASTTVYVENSGAIELDDTQTPTDDDRQKDSRHMHVDYNGCAIITATQQILLDFDSNGTTDTTIVIADHLSGGQILWEDTVQSQTLKIQTHQLNGGVGSNETKFSIHRDQRFNTKALTIRLSGDIGTLISYDVNGIVTEGTSACAVATEQQ
jgi:prepilin-type N-terminal cleavage/methylation domain-containing protein